MTDSVPFLPDLSLVPSLLRFQGPKDRFLMSYKNGILTVRYKKESIALRVQNVALLRIYDVLTRNTYLKAREEAWGYYNSDTHDYPRINVVKTAGTFSTASISTFHATWLATLGLPIQDSAKEYKQLLYTSHDLLRDHLSTHATHFPSPLNKQNTFVSLTSLVEVSRYVGIQKSVTINADVLNSQVSILLKHHGQFLEYRIDIT